MTKRLRPFLIAFALMVLVPVIGKGTIAQERDFIQIQIVLNVTPNPLAMRAAPAQSMQAGQIVARASLHGAPAALERVFEAHALHFQPGGIVIAQAAPTAQKAVKVEAEVSPNPIGTLLTTNAPGQQVVINGTAGTTVHVTCAYQVSVDTTISNWQLDDALATDFGGQTSGSIPGVDLGNDTYIATPLPTSTPFTVMADNGNHSALVGINSGAKTFCVDLVMTIPGTTPQGEYTTNAIYSLFF